MTTLKPHSIRIFLLDGIPDGVRTAEIIMSTIEAIAFPRSLLGRVKRELNLKRPGVYVLVGRDETAPDKMIGYVGESEDLGQRLSNHEKDSANEFWLETIAFTCKDENLTKSHVRYVEAELIKIAKKNPFWTQPKNKQNPESSGKLPLADRVSMDEFVMQARIVAGTLGVDIFKDFEGDQKHNSPPQTDPDQANSVLFHLNGDGYHATAIHSEESGDLIVKAGSSVRKDLNPSLPTGSKKLRDELVANETLKQTDSGYTFSIDFAFSSPSGAANVVTGSSTNGRTSWKTANNGTYADFLASKSANQ
jgi:hypothetical protein